MKRGCCFLLFCAVWCLFLVPLVAGKDKVGYIFTGSFHVEGADPLGINGAHFVLTAAVDTKAKPLSFVDHGDYQGTAVYPAGSCLTIWGAANPALNVTYLPSEDEPDTVTAGWTSHSATDKFTFNAVFVLEDGTVEQPLSVARFYVGLSADCIYALPCTPTIDWVYANTYDLYGESFSTEGVFGQSLSVEIQASDNDAALALQYAVDAVAQLVPQLGDSILGPLWIAPDQRPDFETVLPLYYACLTQGPVSSSLSDSERNTLNSKGKAFPGAVYLETTLGAGGSRADFAFFFDPLSGPYEIEVEADKGATATDVFSVVTVSRSEGGAAVNLVSDGQAIGSEKRFSYTDPGP